MISLRSVFWPTIFWRDIATEIDQPSTSTRAGIQNSVAKFIGCCRWWCRSKKSSLTSKLQTTGARLWLVANCADLVTIGSFAKSAAAEWGSSLKPNKNRWDVALQSKCYPNNVCWTKRHCSSLNERPRRRRQCTTPILFPSSAVAKRTGIITWSCNWSSATHWIR